ncbi:MAG: alpha/beta hydrolase family protein [Alphaproteobacteria bacterium]
MSETTAERTIALDEERSVSALLDLPADAQALYVLAHGAGAGMTHRFMGAIATALTVRRIATLRYNFHYMERGSRRPDSPRIAHAAVRAAVTDATIAAPGLPLFAGGKSFGGRMTSQAQAAAALPGVHGLIFMGFPLHPPGKVGSERGDHLFDVAIPMLFLQGARDEFAKLELLEPLCERLGASANLRLIESGNHSFRVPKATGLSEADVIDVLADAAAAWITQLLESK